MSLPYILLLAASLRVEAGTVATYHEGVVTRDDVESWNRYLSTEGRSLRPGPLRAQVERIVSLRTLDRLFTERVEPEKRQGCERQFRLWQLELGQRRLRDTMRSQSGPPESEVRAIFEASPEAYRQPRHWQLQNIFKRYPEGATEQDKARIRETMEGIRRRAVAGEDFSSLAQQESESETRLRGGNLGAVSLDRLGPDVARVVGALREGDLSPVFEAPGGLTLLRCTKVIEAREPSLEEARPRIARPLGEERFQKSWKELTERVQAALAASLHPEVVLTGSAHEVAASFAAGGSRETLSRADIETYLSGKRLEARKLSTSELQGRLAERVLLEGLGREAESRGLLRQDGDEALFRWKTLELRAREVEASFQIEEPTEARLRAAFEERKDDYVAKARARLEALKLRLRPGQPREPYERARRLGERLAAGEVSFDEAARQLSPPAERVDLGWMTDDQVWMLGVNVDNAVKQTPAGGSTRLAQEGKDLYLLHVLAREPERRLSFDEAREDLLKALREAARQEKVRRLVDAQKVVLAE